MDASEWSADAQMMYLKLAARRGDWRDLRKLGVEPTETMKRLFIPMRAKRLDQTKKQDMREEFERAMPHEWFEVEPGHFVWAHSLERARALATIVAQTEAPWHQRELRYPEIDTSRTCPQHGCKDCQMCPPKEKTT